MKRRQGPRWSRWYMGKDIWRYITPRQRRGAKRHANKVRRRNDKEETT